MAGRGVVRRYQSALRPERCLRRARSLTPGIRRSTARASGAFRRAGPVDFRCRAGAGRRAGLAGRLRSGGPQAGLCRRSGRALLSSRPDFTSGPVPSRLGSRRAGILRRSPSGVRVGDGAVVQLRPLLEARGIVVSVLLGKRSTSPSGPQPTQEFTQVHKPPVWGQHHLGGPLPRPQPACPPARAAPTPPPDP